MTFDEFKLDFLKFLEDSTVNLGRRTTKTRQIFIAEITAKLDKFMDDSEQVGVSTKVVKKTSTLSGSVMRIKPANQEKALNIGKGVHAMTSSESARADEQLNRSPFTNRTKKKGK